MSKSFPSVVVWGMLALLAVRGEELRIPVRLYTPPDPSAPGGIAGRMASPDRQILLALAVPPAQPHHVYLGEILGDDRRSFRFAGLPMDRYDLFLMIEDAFYEGMQLSREADTLTAEDRAEIRALLERSEPYFPVKIIHRLEGRTGRGGEARAVCTFGREGLRRTYKLALLKHVGPGWQVERTRELYPLALDGGGKITSRHTFHQSLSGVRVTDHIRDLGALEL